MHYLALLPLPVLALAACAPVEAPEKPTPAGCPVLADRNWHAWIDRMPGPGATPTLNISGEVDLPTPGYAVLLEEGPADRAMPPGLHFTLEARPPGGMTTQVVTKTAVRYREPTPYPRIRQIVIACGDRTLVTIPDVSITE